MRDALRPPLHRTLAQAPLLLALMLASCTAAPPPQEKTRGPRPDDCLQGVTINRLEKAIRQCDAVVAAHPRLPQPRNDRALLLSLAGRNRAACRDSEAAAALLARMPRQPAADPLLVEEVQLRRQSCRTWMRSRETTLTTPPAAGAPSAATPGVPTR
ncbi:MAG: hypothetical protein ACKOGI_04140 [Vulcanococcus sp.]